VLDIGCGAGDVAHWMAEQGFEVLCIDIVKAAIERARTSYLNDDNSPLQERLSYLLLDICQELPPNAPYSVLFDRGCFHQIPYPLIKQYV
jgi:protein-L-isoaspartate O-methyltransferase